MFGNGSEIITDHSYADDGDSDGFLGIMDKFQEHLKKHLGE